MSHTTEATNDPETIRSEIDQTRERMDQTIDALAERVKGRHLLDEILGLLRSSNGVARARQWKDKVSSSTESAFHSVADSIKSDPAPALLIGAGVTWMIYSSVKSHGTKRPLRGNRYMPDFPSQGRPDLRRHLIMGLVARTLNLQHRVTGPRHGLSPRARVEPCSVCQGLQQCALEVFRGLMPGINRDPLGNSFRRAMSRLLGMVSFKSTGSWGNDLWIEVLPVSTATLRSRGINLPMRQDVSADRLRARSQPVP